MGVQSLIVNNRPVLQTVHLLVCNCCTLCSVGADCQGRFIYTDPGLSPLLTNPNSLHPKTIKNHQIYTIFPELKPNNIILSAIITFQSSFSENVVI